MYKWSRNDKNKKHDRMINTLQIGLYKTNVRILDKGEPSPTCLTYGTNKKHVLTECS